MRTGSHQVTATILAAGFLGGWLSASWIAPAPVTTQVAPARPVPAAPVVDIPHVALSRVQAPDTSPVTSRNPFVFHDRVRPEAAPGARREAGAPPASDLAVTTDTVDAPVAAPALAWRLVGLATAADGGMTAILTGALGLHLAAAGGTLPDGAAIASIEGTRVTLHLPNGTVQTLDLP